MKRMPRTIRVYDFGPRIMVHFPTMRSEKRARMITSAPTIMLYKPVLDMDGSFQVL